MSPIAIGLDLLLVTLLVTALLVGLRLSGQLRKLRDGQAGFIKAVAELDTSAGRAESALKALKAASETAHDELLTRIETARGLIAKLETANVAAAARLEALPPPVPRPAALARPVEAPAAPPTPGPAPRSEARLDPRFRGPPRRTARELDADLFAEPEPLGPLGPLAPARDRLRAAPVHETLSELRRRLGERG